MPGERRQALADGPLDLVDVDPFPAQAGLLDDAPGLAGPPAEPLGMTRYSVSGGLSGADRRAASSRMSSVAFTTDAPGSPGTSFATANLLAPSA